MFSAPWGGLHVNSFIQPTMLTEGAAHISQAALLLDLDMNHHVTQFLTFFFCVAGHFKDPGIWHKTNVWLDSTKMEAGHLATLQLLCWLWPRTNRDAEVQSGSWQLSRAGMAPAFGLKQPQVHCVYDCIAILCGLMPASDGNLAPADTLCLLPRTMQVITGPGSPHLILSISFHQSIWRPP